MYHQPGIAKIIIFFPFFYQVTAVCNEAALSAMQEDITTDKLQERHFKSAIDSIKPQTTDTMVKYYEDYASATKR